MTLILAFMLFVWNFNSVGCDEEDGPLVVKSILTEDIGYLPTIDEGFVFDLVELLAKRVVFTYELKLVADERYGTKSINDSWNGMIGELEADMAVAPMPINSVWNRVVDFSHPFKTTGYRMLMKKSTSSKIMSFEDMVSNNEVTLVVVQDSAAELAFKTNKEDVIAKKLQLFSGFRAATHREGVRKILTAGTDHPVVMVLPEDLAEAYVRSCRFCDLTIAGDRWHEFGYGIAFPLDSPHKAAIDLALLELMEDGTIHELRDKWFGTEHPSWSKCACQPSGRSDMAQSRANLNHNHLYPVVIVVIAVFLWIIPRDV